MSRYLPSTGVTLRMEDLVGPKAGVLGDLNKNGFRYFTTDQNQKFYDIYAWVLLNIPGYASGSEYIWVPTEKDGVEIMLRFVG